MSSSSRTGVVAAGHPRVIDAAEAMLRAGGNAFDAIVAAGFATSVVEPCLTSLGGGGFLLAVSPDGATLYDFFCDTPGRGHPDPGKQPHFEPVTIHFTGADQVFHVGLGSVAVPGNLLGLVEVQRRRGKLPLAEVLAPSIQFAREGTPLNPTQAFAVELLWPILNLTDRGRELFCPGGHKPGIGNQLAFPDTADFLERLPKGGLEDFYRGELAKTIARELDEGGGTLTVEDLANYQVIERKPLERRYRGRRVLMNPPPSGGGLAVARYLRLLEGIELGELRFHDPAHVRTLAAAMREGERLRGADDDEAALLTALETVRQFSRGTTHVSVADADGNVASMTTSNGEGSGYVVPGTGIMLNNMLGEDDLHPEGWHQDPPGVRISSMMCPTIILDDDGTPVLALGSGGSKRIRTAILQVATGVLDFGLHLTEAVNSPRIHWDGESLQVEGGLSEEALSALREDFELHAWDAIDLYFGGVHAVVPEHEGAGDPRRGGCSRVISGL
jgi:gamma-glutamyltranspeptidase/glutathione hydrolase